MVDRLELGSGAYVEHRQCFVGDDEALLAALLRSLPLSQETLTIFGRPVLTPRLTSWHGDAGCRYRYSGRTFDPLPWTQELTHLRARLQDHTGIRFNSVLANLYRDGSDAMGAHSDDEAELGPSSNDVQIASVSLGARRRFVLSRKDKSEKPRVFELGRGDLFRMGGTTQQHYRHALPRTKRPVGVRLNLTFRLIRYLWR